MWYLPRNFELYLHVVPDCILYSGVIVGLDRAVGGLYEACVKVPSASQRFGFLYPSWAVYNSKHTSLHYYYIQTFHSIIIHTSIFNCSLFMFFLFNPSHVCMHVFASSGFDSDCWYFGSINETILCWEWCGIILTSYVLITSLLGISPEIYPINQHITHHNIASDFMSKQYIICYVFWLEIACLLCINASPCPWELLYFTCIYTINKKHS